MPARKRKAQETPELCAEHFPYGLADQPEDATQVSCGHGTWNVADIKDAAPKDPEDPETPPKGDGGEGGEGGSGGDGDQGDGSGKGDGK